MSSKEQELEQLETELKRLVRKLETPLLGYLNTKRYYSDSEWFDINQEIKRFLGEPKKNRPKNVKTQKDMILKYKDKLQKNNPEIATLIKQLEDVNMRIENLKLEMQGKTAETTSGSDTESMGDSSDSSDTESDEEMQDTGTADKGTGTADNPYVVELLKF